MAEAEDLLSKGVEFYRLGKYKEALKSFEEVIKIKPDSARAWNDRSATLYKLKIYREALISFEEAIRLKPDFLEAWNNKAVLLSEFRRYKEAIESFEKVLELRKSLLDFFLLLSWTMLTSCSSNIDFWMRFGFSCRRGVWL